MRVEARKRVQISGIFQRNKTSVGFLAKERERVGGRPPEYQGMETREGRGDVVAKGTNQGVTGDSHGSK